MTTPIQLPLAKGLRKNAKTADYDAELPVNMLATVGEVLNAAGYMRSFPGIDFLRSAAGVSRGAQYNTFQGVAYRVAGNSIYKGSIVRASDVAGNGRVNLAHSDDSQVVCANGVVTLYNYDGTQEILRNWPAGNPQGYPTDYDIGTPIDVCRNRARYIWVKGGTNTFGITDLANEAHPDGFNPFYTAEIKPDKLLGCGMWRDFVVAFGSSSIEFFSLTGATDTTSARYITQPSLMIDQGIAGTDAKCEYQGTWAFVSNSSMGAPSVYLMGQGEATKISTIAIEKKLRQYTDEQLATIYMESLNFDLHTLLIIHLPDETLCFDGAGTSTGPQWCVLKSGTGDDVYRGVDFIFENGNITVGDKLVGQVGQLSYTKSGQYDDDAEFILTTPLAKIDRARLFDLEIEAATGAAQMATRMFISATGDGVVFGQERSLEYDAPFRYDRRVLWRRLGYVRKNIGFRFRIVTSSPVTLSGCTLRAE
jgi:hypothetical protein